MNASEPLTRRRKHYVMSKPNTRGEFGRNEKGMQVLFSWHPAYRRHEFYSGFFFLATAGPIVTNVNRKATRAAMSEGESREVVRWFGPIHTSEEGQ